MGTKRPVLTDEKGCPLAVVLSGANTHDVKLPGDTLDSLVIAHPQINGGKPQNLCMDAGYTGHQDEAELGNTPRTSALVGRKRRSWNITPTFTLVAGSLRWSILL